MVTITSKISVMVITKGEFSFSVVIADTSSTGALVTQMYSIRFMVTKKLSIRSTERIIVRVMVTSRFKVLRLWLQRG